MFYLFRWKCNAFWAQKLYSDMNEYHKLSDDIILTVTSQRPGDTFKETGAALARCRRSWRSRLWGCAQVLTCTGMFQSITFIYLYLVFRQVRLQTRVCLVCVIVVPIVTVGVINDHYKAIKIDTAMFKENHIWNNNRVFCLDESGQFEMTHPQEPPYCDFGGWECSLPCDKVRDLHYVTIELTLRSPISD